MPVEAAVPRSNVLLGNCHSQAVVQLFGVWGWHGEGGGTGQEEGRIGPRLWVELEEDSSTESYASLWAGKQWDLSILCWKNNWYRLK